MDEAEESPSAEVRSAKRARPGNLNASQLQQGLHSAEAALPASTQPAHTKALRSVLKGTRSPALCTYDFWLQFSHTANALLCLQCSLSRRVRLYVEDSRADCCKVAV